VSDLPGVDLDALTRWLDAEHPGLRSGPLSGELITGGKSNLTYRITDGTVTWALRRPPLGHVLPTAHNMSREYQVIDALRATNVPVAAAIAMCADPDVLGAPFYLMSFVDGVVLDTAAALSNLDKEAARTACEQLVDTLVELHAVDPIPIGLGGFGRPDGFLLRQVNRWQAQWQASQTRPLPVLDQVVDTLLAALPRSPASGIVHGDYRLTNVIFRRDLTGIAAVVDWEMATLGDPLTDLGLLVVYQTLSADSDLLMPRVGADAGFLTADEMTDRYAARSGRDLAELGWYIAFGFFKLAVIAEGIHHRYLDGKTVGSGFAQFGDAVPELLATAFREIRALHEIRALRKVR
jgi:aminoglycoside phosphotransferase (APT) family kinase protein